MDLWDSPVRVMWDPDGTRLVLVPYGAPMWDPVRIDGGQVVQTAALVRGAGTKNYGRGNDSHTLTFTLARVDKVTVEAAFIARIENTISTTLPRSMADVLLSFASGPQFRLKNAAVQSWPNDQEDYVTRETLVILGGEIAADFGTYEEALTWGEPPTGGLEAEDGEGFETEGGETIDTEA